LKNFQQTEEIRWQLIKSMLEEFPELKQKLRSYLKQEQRNIPKS
jgi:hypothetical protein